MFKGVQNAINTLIKNMYLLLMPLFIENIAAKQVEKIIKKIKNKIECW